MGSFQRIKTKKINQTQEAPMTNRMPDNYKIFLGKKKILIFLENM